MKRRHAATTTSRRSTRNQDDDAAVGPPAKRPRGRPRKKQPPQLPDPRQQISFYAVKASSIIEEPIIFFGLKDLNLLQQYLSQQQSQHEDIEGSVVLAYKKFDNLANALHYVQTPTNEKEQDDMVARKPPAEKEPERRSARKKKSAAVNNNNSDQERSEPTQQKRPSRKKTAATTAIANPPSDAEETSPKKTGASLKKTRKKAPKKTSNPKTQPPTTTTVTPLLPIQPRPLVPPAPRPVDEPQVAEAAGQDVDTTTTTTTANNKSGQEPPQERNDDNIAPTTMTTTTTNAMLPGPRPMVRPLPPSRPAEGEQQGQETTAGNNNNSSKIGRPQGYRNTWEEGFQLLVDFKQEYGHLKIPSKKVSIPNPKYHSLAHWARKQRKELADFQPPPEMDRMSLSDRQKMERKQKLQNLGFEIWYKCNRVAVNRQEIFNKVFQKRLKELKEFKAKHGHVKVPSGTSLYTWLFSLRKTYRDATTTQQKNNSSSSSRSSDNNRSVSLLTLEHIGALKDLGVTMEMSYHCTSTRQAVQEYVDFVKTHGKFPDFSSTNAIESKLARTSVTWRQMRRQFEETSGGDTTTTTANANDQETTDGGNSNNNNAAAAAASSSRTSRFLGNRLSQDLIDALDSVNFRWIMKRKPRTKPRADINNKTPWETKFQAVKAYIDKYGMEPTNRHKVLGDFVKHIRKEYSYMVQGKRSTLTLERFRKLTQAGFRFNVKRQRRYGFEGSDGGESSGGEGEAAAAAVEESDDAFFGTTDNSNDNNYNHHVLWAAYTRRSL